MKAIKQFLIPVVLTCAVMSSCLPVFDVVRLTRVRNSTNDTILIGMSDYDCVDSVTYFMYNMMDTIPPTRIERGRIVIQGGVILPDSLAQASDVALFNSHGKGYLFVVKLNVAKAHAWNEICKRKMYDKFPITNDMLKEMAKKKKYFIDYKPRKVKEP